MPFGRALPRRTSATHFLAMHTRAVRECPLVVLATGWSMLTNTRVGALSVWEDTGRAVRSGARKMVVLAALCESVCWLRPDGSLGMDAQRWFTLCADG